MIIIGSLLCPEEWRQMVGAVLISGAGFALLIGNVFQADESR